MNDCRFSTGNLFRWNDIDYLVIRSLPNNQINIENLITTGLLIVDEIELVRAVFGGTLTFYKPGELGKGFSPNGELAKYKHTVVKMREFEDYTPYQQRIARYRLEIVSNVPIAATTKQRQEYVKACKLKYPGMPISLDSLYRWEHLYYGGSEDIRDLCPQTERKDRKGTFPDEVEQIISSTFEDMLFRNISNSPNPELPTAKMIHEEIAARIADANLLRSALDQLPTPSERTINRRILELDAFELYAARYGRKAARDKYRQYGKIKRPPQPLDEVEADFTSIDVIVVDENYIPLGRPLWGKSKDRYSGLHIGFYLGFEPESAFTIAALLYDSIRLKEDVQKTYGTENPLLAYGMPRELHVDGGSGNRGMDLRDACQSLGIRLVLGAPGTPQSRPIIERGFHADNEGLIHHLAGTTFSNILERGNYDSVENAVITLHELKTMLYTYYLDHEDQNFHRGVNGIPARLWEEAVQRGFKPRLPFGAEELYILLGRVAWRVLNHYGIDLFNLRYNLIGNNRLSDIRAEMDRLKKMHKGKLPFSYKVKCKYHADNLGSIRVNDPFSKDEWFEVPALDQEYAAGLSLWQHRVICRNARSEERSVDIAALGRARRRIEGIMFEALQGKRSSKQTHSFMARYTGGSAFKPQLPSDTSHAQPAPPIVVPETTLLPHPQLTEHLNAIIENTKPDGWQIGPNRADKRK